MKTECKRSSRVLRNRMFLISIGFILLVSFSLGAVQALAAKKTVRMWWWGNVQGRAPREEAMKQIIPNFEAAHPDIKIVNEPQVWSTIGAKFFTAHQAGNAPDICWVTCDDLNRGWKLGAYADLNELFINEWTEEERNDFFPPAMWNFGVENGKKYQVWLSGGGHTPVIRKNLFAEEGIEYPIRTWDKFIEAAQKLTKDTDGDGKTDVWGLGQTLGSEKIDLTLWVFALLDLQGDRIFTEDGKAMWATDAGVKAMKLQTDLITKYKVTPPGSVTYTSEDTYSQFSGGLYAMNWQSVVRIARQRSNVAGFDPLSITVMPPPSWEGARQGPAHMVGWCVVVWSKSPVEKEAGKFVEWMINPESDKIWMTAGGQVPKRRSTCKDPFFHKPENDYMRVWADAWEKRAWTLPWKIDTSGCRLIFNRAAQKIILEGKDIREALLEAEKSFNERYK